MTAVLTFLFGTLAYCKDLHLPCYVLACKSDVAGGISATDASRAATPYSRVIEISTSTDEGKWRMRKAVDTLIKDITNPRGMLVVCFAPLIIDAMNFMQ